MTDNEIIKALEICYQLCRDCEDCPYENIGNCYTNLKIDARDLIKRQQAKIDELTVKEARFAFDRIHYNIKELNLIQEGYNIEKLKKRFRAEFEENMELGVDDCINWADWLDSIASEMWKEVKCNDR